METAREIFKRNVKLYIRYLGKSIETICKESNSGVSPKLVRGWIYKGTPTLRTLEKISKLLDLTVSEIVDPNFDAYKAAQKKLSK